VPTTRTLIRDFSPSQLVEGVFALQNCQLGKTKNGKPFLKCLIGDRSARTPGRMWNISEERFRQLPTNGFVYIEGQAQPYQGEIQIIIQHIQPVKPSEQDLEDLLPHTHHNIEQMFAELTERLATIQHPAIQALVQAYQSDENLMTRFRRAPAAMALHHAYIGGLLEHTLSLIRLADVFCPLYPHLNRDLIVAGLFIHDLGKCAELSWDSGFTYTEDGLLVGHIARGVTWLQQKADQCAEQDTPIPAPILRVLEHIILSHHGKAEFGALKIPATPEAIAVSLLDNLDAKLQMAIAATREDVPVAEVGGPFTEKIWALETRLYRPDPTTLDSNGH